MISFGGNLWGLRGKRACKGKRCYRTPITLGSSGGVVAIQTGYGYNYGLDYGSAT